MSLPIVPDNLENTVRVREYLASLRNSIDLEITGLDRYAADRIVSLDPSQGTDTTIQSAINNLPAGGGTIYIKSGTYPISASIILPDKPVVVSGSGDSSMISLSGAIAAFTIPNGLSERRQYYFKDFCIEGTGIAGQTAWALQDTNARGNPYTDYVNVKAVEALFDVQAYDVTYSYPLSMHFSHAYFIPPNLTTATPIKTPNPANTYAAIAELIFFESEIDKIEYYASGATGVSFNCDADIIFDHTDCLIRGNASCNGFGGKDCLIQGAMNLTTNSLTSYGVSDSEYFELIGIQFYLLTINWNGFDQKFVACQINDSKIITSGSASFIGCLWFTAAGPIDVGLDIAGAFSIVSVTNCEFAKSFHGSYSTAAIRVAITNVSISAQFKDYAPSWTDHTPIGVQLLSGANGCDISGKFTQDFTATAIQVASNNILIHDSLFSEGSTHKTVTEVGSADSNEITGCTGLGSGAGPVLLGAHTRINGSLDRNVMDFGADPVGAASSAAAFKKAASVVSAAGGVVLVPPGTYKIDATLIDVLGNMDKDITWQLDPGALLNIVGAITAFGNPDGLTAIRHYIVCGGGKIHGDLTAGQELCRHSDTGGRGRWFFTDIGISGVETLINIAAGDAANYSLPVLIYFTRCHAPPPNLATPVLAKTPDAYNASTFGSVVTFRDCDLADFEDRTQGWTWNAAMDLVFCSSRVEVKANSASAGLFADAPSQLFQNQTGVAPFAIREIKFTDPSWSNLASSEAFFSGIKIICEATNYRLRPVLRGSSWMQVSGAGCEVDINDDNAAFNPNTLPAVLCDLIAGAVGCRVRGVVTSFTAAGVQVATTNNHFAVQCPVLPGGTKVIKELAGADFNVAAGCTGLGVAAANVTVVGANSRYDTTIANTT